MEYLNTGHSKHIMRDLKDIVTLILFTDVLRVVMMFSPKISLIGVPSLHVMLIGPLPAEPRHNSKKSIIHVTVFRWRLNCLHVDLPIFSQKPDGANTAA